MANLDMWQCTMGAFPMPCYPILSTSGQFQMPLFPAPVYVYPHQPTTVLTPNVYLLPHPSYTAPVAYSSCRGLKRKYEDDVYGSGHAVELSAYTAPAFVPHTPLVSCKRPATFVDQVQQPKQAAGQVVPLLRHCLNLWIKQLTTLQPKFSVPLEVLEYCISVFGRFKTRTALTSMAGSIPPPATCIPGELAACLWIAIKSDGPRASVPSRTLLSTATGVSGEMLTSKELEILIALDWKVGSCSSLSQL